MVKCLYCGKEILEGVRRKYHPICIKRKYNQNNKHKSREYYNKNKEIIYEKQKVYNSNNKEKINKIKKNWSINNREFVNKKSLEYSKRNRDKINKRQKEYKKNNKKRVNAEVKAQQKIPLKDKCEICGSTKNLQRHHWNYDKPLLVNTLCGECHKIQHIKDFRNSYFGRVSC